MTSIPTNQKVRPDLVLRVDHARWGHTIQDLRRLATTASHPRSRERFLALYDIAQAGCATQVARRTGRRPDTVMGWRHTYNEGGPEPLLYRRTGGRPPFTPRSRPVSARSCGGYGVPPPLRP